MKKIQVTNEYLIRTYEDSSTQNTKSIDYAPYEIRGGVIGDPFIGTSTNIKIANSDHRLRQAYPTTTDYDWTNDADKYSTHVNEHRSLHPKSFLTVYDSDGNTYDEGYLWLRNSGNLKGNKIFEIEMLNPSTLTFSLCKLKYFRELINSDYIYQIAWECNDGTIKYLKNKSFYVGDRINPEPNGNIYNIGANCKWVSRPDPHISTDIMYDYVLSQWVGLLYIEIFGVRVVDGTMYSQITTFSKTVTTFNDGPFDDYLVGVSHVGNKCKNLIQLWPRAFKLSDSLISTDLPEIRNIPFYCQRYVASGPFAR